MISLMGVTHSVVRGGNRIPIFVDASFEFDRRRMGLVAARDEQMNAILDVLIGYRLPDVGTVRRRGAVSWPIGRLLQFRSELSGRDTVRFITQLYGLDFRRSEDLFHDLIDFEQHYEMPVSTWPGLLTVKFAHCAVLLPEFDIYIGEGSMIIGDDKFMQRWLPMFEEKLVGRQLIMACGQAAHLSKFCRSAAVLRDGELVYYDDIETACRVAGWSPFGKVQDYRADTGPGDVEDSVI